MIAQNEVARLTFTSNLAAFDITFQTFDSSSINVYVILLSDETKTSLVEDTDYTLSDLGVNGVDAGIALIDAGQAWIDGTSKLDNALYSLVVEISPEAFQPGSFRSLGNYSPITLEAVLDRCVMFIKSLKNYIDDALADIATNTANIATNVTNIATNVTNIATNLASIQALEGFLYSSKQALSDNATAALTNGTIDEVDYSHMVLTYVCVRNSSIQFGRLLISDEAPFVDYQLEKTGDVGLSFSVNEAGGVGTVSATTTSTGNAATIFYSLYKFTA